MASDPKNQNRDSPNRIKIIVISIILFLVVIGLWLGYSNWIESQFCSYETRGQFGDMFGSLNTLFTGLAFAGLIVTILFQVDELKLQRDELQLQRKELSSTRTTMNRQRFESTFFNMVTLHFKLIEFVKFNDFKGLNAFLHFNGEFLGYYTEHGADSLAKMKDHFFKFHFSHYPFFSPYIRSIVQLYKIIKESNFKNTVKKRYYDLLSSYITVAEKAFLSYYIHLSDKPELLELDRDLKIVRELRDAKILDIALQHHANV